MTDRTLAPGEVVEITEAQASTLLGEEPNGFFVGYESPDWAYFHAPRSTPPAARTAAETPGKGRP